MTEETFTRSAFPPVPSRSRNGLRPTGSVVPRSPFYGNGSTERVAGSLEPDQEKDHGNGSSNKNTKKSKPEKQMPADLHGWWLIAKKPFHKDCIPCLRATGAPNHKTS